MSQNCNCSENQTTSFIFGLFFGAIVAGVVAVLIHRHQKSKVVTQLKKYLQDLIDRFTSSLSPKDVKPKATPKIAVDIPQNLKTFSPTSLKKKTPVKTFVKPKKK